MSKIRHALLIIMAIQFITSCKNETKENVVVQNETKKIDSSQIMAFIDSLPFRNYPYFDSTNFDNISKKEILNQSYIDFFKLSKIELTIDQMWIRNKFNFSENFNTFLIHVYPNENELYTILSTYTKKFELIDYKIIAYDEIAESCLRKESFVDKNKILIYSFDFCYKNTTDTTEYVITDAGEIKLKKENIIDTTNHQLLHIFYSNGGILAFYTDGTVTGCPQCDLDKNNIDLLKSKGPFATYTIDKKSIWVQYNNGDKTEMKFYVDGKLSDDWAMKDGEWLK